MNEVGVWVRPDQVGPASFDYTDGERTEAYIKRVIVESDDVSSVSAELERGIVDWPTEYHLSGARANLLRALEWGGGKRILEVGCGCGSLTRYLGESELDVDAIEGSPVRAEIARKRCKNLDNVRVTNVNYNELALPEDTYDIVLFIGVLEYAGRFYVEEKKHRDAVIEILRKAKGALTKDGVIVVAMENRLGLKYQCGANEDHYGRPYIGIFHYLEEQGIRTYDKREWAAIFEELPIRDYGFCYPFPDYKMARAILSEQYISQEDSVISHLYGLTTTRATDGDSNRANEYNHWEALDQAGYIQDFANSFLIFASDQRESIRNLFPYDFVGFSSAERKIKYRTVTKKRAEGNLVTKEPVVAPREPDLAGSLLAQTFRAEKYISGTVLSVHWYRKLAVYGDLDGFAEDVKQYYEFLKEQATGGGGKTDKIDLIPGNIVVDQSNRYGVIDQEWKTRESVDTELILFRALLYFAIANRVELAAIVKAFEITTIGGFIKYMLKKVGVDYKSRLRGYIDYEQRIQEEVSGTVRARGVYKALDSGWEDNEVRGVFVPKIYWAAVGKEFTEEHTVCAKIDAWADRQILRFRLPREVDGIGWIRFDPNTGPGYFHIFSIQIGTCGANGNNTAVKWERRGAEKIEEEAKLKDVVFCEAPIGNVFVSVSGDPQLIFEVGDVTREGLDHIIFVDIEMEWGKSKDFLIARETFVKDMAAMEKENRDLWRAKEERDRLRQELSIIRSSRIWRTAELLRNIIYVRIFGRFPFLQRVLLKWGRHGLG